MDLDSILYQDSLSKWQSKNHMLGHVGQQGPSLYSMAKKMFKIVLTKFGNVSEKRCGI